MRAFLRTHWFVLAMLGAVALAWSLPSLPGAAWQEAAKFVLVGLVFFLSGLSLRTREVWAGLGHWKLHVFVQVLSLGVLPLTSWGLVLVLGVFEVDPALLIGFVVLGALPTTISSCVVLTTAAGGNQVGALVNASLGNLLGVLVTPIWIVLLTEAAGVEIDLRGVFIKLASTVLLPVVAGQVVQAALGARLGQRVRTKMGQATQFVLIAIMFVAFSGAFGAGGQITTGAIVLTAAVCVVLHSGWLALPWVLSRLPVLGFTRADRVCALICVSQKTLAFGLPLIAVCFAGSPALTLITLPVLVYHPLQLLVAGSLVPRLRGFVSAGSTPV